MTCSRGCWPCSRIPTTKRSPSGPPARPRKEYAGTQYCGWRDGGIQSSAAIYRRHLLSQFTYFTQLIEKLEGTVKDTMKVDDEVAQNLGHRAEELT